MSHLRPCQRRLYPSVMQPDLASAPQVIGAIVAASIAALIGLLNIVATVWQGHLTRNRQSVEGNRDQWWTRFVWAIERLEAHPQAENLAADVVLHTLAAVRWVDPDDRDMAEAFLADFNADITVADVEEAERGQDNSG